MNSYPSPTPKTIWVIDDDETALMLAEEVLTDAGFRVRTFLAASDALAFAQSQLPDLVVVDVMMPGIDGFEFCSRLRHLPRGASVPVLVTTSLDDTTSINRAFEAGATNFSTKPINWSIEIHRLHYLLRAAATAQALQEKELEARRAKEEWERTFNAITDSVTVLDPELRIQQANAAVTKHHGLTASAVTGRHCYEVFQSNRQPCSGCPVVDSLANVTSRFKEMPCAYAASVCGVSASPVVDEQGQVRRIVHVARDLSEQKQLEAELRQAQKMEAIGTLAGGIAHDFNNLLTVIVGYAELLSSEKLEKRLDNTDEQAILQASRRGAALAKQLLIFSRKGSADSRKEPLDPNASVKNLRKMLDRVLPKNVVLQQRLAPDLFSIQGDAGQLEQVLMNLSVNAAHAMPNGGSLTIESQNVRLGPDCGQLHPNVKPGDYVLLTVSDTGHGMDKKTLERIYEPFFTTKRVGEGTGLGLSVVFGIVRDHDGYISCYSEVGVGTTFRIYLPAVPAAGQQLQHRSEVSEKDPVGTETILVADDEAPIRRLVEMRLSNSGYKVLTASDGEVALRRYCEASEMPHAVILDLGMPKMSGWACLQKLRLINPRVKVLVASGYIGDELERRALNEGAAAFVRKPYDMRTMSRRLREILDAPAPG